MRRLLVGGVLAGLGFALAAIPAGAKTRGTNGQIVYERQIADQPNFPGSLASVMTANPDGTKPRRCRSLTHQRSTAAPSGRPTVTSFWPAT
jgi:hypothetical protein